MVAGTYDVIVTDANGCQETLSHTITEPTGVEIALETDSFTELVCFEDSDGYLNITVTEGTPPYSYSCLLYTSPSPRD